MKIEAVDLFYLSMPEVTTEAVVQAPLRSG